VYLDYRTVAIDLWEDSGRVLWMGRTAVKDITATIHEPKIEGADLILCTRVTLRA
jgi:hypothetical protein